MLSRHVARMTLQRLLFSPSAPFCQGAPASHPESSPFWNKVLATQNFSDFYQVFENNRNAFDANLPLQVNSHISKLVSRSEVNPASANQLVATFLASNIGSLSMTSSVSLLGVLRTFNQKKISIKDMQGLKKAVGARLNQLLKDFEIQPNKLGDSMQANYELSYHRLFPELRLLQEKIQRAMNKAESIPLRQVTSLLRAISFIISPNTIQRALRARALRIVQKNLEDIETPTLIHLVISINHMETFNLQPEEGKIIRNVFDAVMDRIDEFEEYEIKQIIESDTSPYDNIGGYKIREKVFQRILAMMDDRGKSKLPQEQVLRILELLTDKIRLSSCSPQDEKKFLLFLERAYLELTKGDKEKLLHRLTNHLLRARFLNRIQVEKLAFIIKESKMELAPSNFYLLVISDADIRPFLPQLKKFEMDGISENAALMLGMAIGSYAKDDPIAQELIGAIKEKIAGMVENQARFAAFVKRARKIQERPALRLFHQNFSDLLDHLPQPFDGEVETSLQYRSAYLSYVEEAYSLKEKNDFVSANKDKIDLDSFAGSLDACLARGLKYEQAKPFYIKTLSLVIKDLLKCEDKRIINTVIDFLGAYARYLPTDRLDKSTKERLFNHLHFLISNIESAPEHSMKLGIALENFFFSHNNYEFEHDFKGLVRHILSKISFWQHHYVPIVKLALERGLKLRLVTAKHLSELGDKIPYLPYAEKQHSKLLLDSSYKSNIDGISFVSIAVMLANPNNSEFVAENKQQILQKLPKMSPNNLISCLSTFDQPYSSPASSEVLQELLKQVIDKVKSFDYLDVNLLVINLLSLNFKPLTRYMATITTKIVDFYTQKPKNISIYTHSDILKLASSFPGVKNKKYVNQLANSFRNDRESFTFLLPKLALYSYPLNQKDIEVIPTVLKATQGPSVLKFFLNIESRLEADKVNQLVNIVIENLKKWETGKSNDKLALIDLNYFKAKYPQQAEKLNIPEEKLQDTRLISEVRYSFLFDRIGEITGKPFSEVEVTPANKLLQCGNDVVGFINAKRTANYNEHQTTKSMIALSIGEGTNVVLASPNVRVITLLDYLRKSCQNLLTEEQYQTLVQEIGEHGQKLKAEEEGQQAEE